MSPSAPPPVAALARRGDAPAGASGSGTRRVDSLAELAGDHEAADRVELELPDTGVCGGSGLFDAPEQATSGGCCTPAPQLVQIGTRTDG